MEDIQDYNDRPSHTGWSGRQQSEDLKWTPNTAFSNFKRFILLGN